MFDFQIKHFFIKNWLFIEQPIHPPSIYLFSACRNFAFFFSSHNVPHDTVFTQPKYSELIFVSIRPQHPQFNDITTRRRGLQINNKKKRSYKFKFRISFLRNSRSYFVISLSCSRLAFVIKGSLHKLLKSESKWMNMQQLSRFSVRQRS